MWCSRKFRDEVIGTLDHLHDDLIELHRLIQLDLGVDMTTNEELGGVKADLTEATGEISAKIDELVAQAGDAADPALVADIKALAEGLANIVPDAPAEPSTPVEPTEPEAEVPAEADTAPESEAPAEPAPDA